MVSQGLTAAKPFGAILQDVSNPYGLFAVPFQIERIIRFLRIPGLKRQFFPSLISQMARLSMARSLLITEVAGEVLECCLDEKH
jgi:hypothetical protein